MLRRPLKWDKGRKMMMLTMTENLVMYGDSSKSRDLSKHGVSGPISVTAASVAMTPASYAGHNIIVHKRVLTQVHSLFLYSQLTTFKKSVRGVEIVLETFDLTFRVVSGYNQCTVPSTLSHPNGGGFTFSETAYFWRWWKEQRPTTRATFRALVQEGRVEFAGGGWVHNDEATPDYLHIIDQYTWGLRKLNDTLGPCGKPKAAWQIDTYGHTREQVSLLAQMGFDGLFIGRVDHKERESMIEEDRMEFMWRGSDVLDRTYKVISCQVNDFISQIERQAKYYDHDNIMVTMGGDFTYQSAANWFMNMDKLINHVTTHPANLSDINIFYSTPSCYLKAIYLYGRRDKAVYTEKVVKQLTVIARLGDSYELHLLRHAVSLVLHHDAITGTSQQHVTYDFIRILSEAIDSCTKKVSNLLSYLTPTWGGSRRTKNNQQFIICHQLNMSQCRFTENQESMLLLVYNPLSVKTYHHVRLPAIALHYTIRDFNDEEVEYQLVPLPAAIINLPGRSSTAIQELCFEAENIPPLGFTAYYIAPVRDQLEENEFAKKFSKSGPGKVEQAEQEIIPFISNEYIKVTVDKASGFLESIQHVDGVRVDVSQNFYYYAQGQQTLQSGAYSFRPDRQRPTPVTDKVTYNTIRGSLVKEIRQRFTDWITQIIRLYRGEEYVELEWIIGPVPIGTDLGKEVVSMFTSNVSSNGEFFTDSNARQMMRRTCWNETASQQQKKPIAACYYPVASRICIHSLNSSVEMCVLTDRSQGGTSYNDGEIELMVHRRLLTDDGFGLEETLNEEAYGVGLVIKGKHRILFGNYRQEVDDQTFSERMSLFSRRWQYEPWLFLTSGEKLNRRKWQNVRNKRFSVLKLHGLPRHIHVLTLEPWKAGTVLLRLENTLENPVRERFKTDKAESPDDYNTKPTHITVELKKIFLQMNIKMVRETTLAANQWLDDARQMDWSTRYVYSGADDGILPEDAEETEDKPAKPAETKDSGHFSEEEAELTRKKYYRRPKFASDKSRSKIKTPVYADYDRRKRAVNVTDNVMDNIINDTYMEDNKYNDTTEPPRNASDVTTRFGNNTTKYAEPFRFLVTQKTPKLSFLSRMKPTKMAPDWGAETEEMVSSEEDFSSNLKKRSPRRRSSKSMKRSKPEEVLTDDVDDGITKSIYEMYYKHRPKVQYRARSVEEEKSRKKKKTRRMRDKNDYDYEIEPTTRKYSRSKNKRRGKSLAADMPFFITDGRRHKGERQLFEEGRRTREKMLNEDGQMKSELRELPLKSFSNIPKSRKRKDSGMEVQDYSDEEDLDVMEKESLDRRGEISRRKRTLPKDDEPPIGEPGNSETVEDVDFVVTLRPTQIRTFVIWFENRKAYT
ncbi:unnamed protein product [Chrysodeixis includens]|uniref:Alpha-mannosidase n=1 Tax=Chrysodeixis includens TaxID=689277 RepID=A0A9P0BT49_CHRIL|nr:unnamed protein product [Chrysodeixis includens]